MKTIFALLLACLLLPFASAQTGPRFDGNTWWNHVKVLADDNMEGRETGSPGLHRAQAYIVEQLKKDGLKPAGTNGYYQPVQFVSRQIVEKDSSLALVRNGKPEPLVLGEDAYFGTRVNLAPHTAAPLVFLGYGLQIPEKNYDDLAGLDLKGKVVVIISGSPQEIPAALASHYQTAAERWKSLRAAGCVGIIGIPNPSSMDIPWSRMSANRAHVSMELADPEFDETAGQKLSVTFNPAHAEQLFLGSGHTFAELVALAKDRKPLPRFPLPLSIAATAKLETTKVESDNIVAKLEGADPKLKGEYVVLSAHIDHIGIGEPINGDKIYNGAMDNGSGSALLLDIADSFNKSPVKLRRSVLFVWVTAEEKGLLGSKYFAAHPTVPVASMIADLNEDMFLPIVPLKVLTVYGLAESDLGDRVGEVADAHGVKIQPDPQPLRNSFIRSDQYNFIRQGVPALAIGFGFEANSPEQKIFKDWLTNRYHAPSDDVNQPVDLAAEGQFESLYRDVVIAVANADRAPQWKPDSFFRRYAKSPTK